MAGARLCMLLIVALLRAFGGQSTLPHLGILELSIRGAWLTASFKRAGVPMAIDPEAIVTLLLLAALAIAWNFRFEH